MGAAWVPAAGGGVDTELTLSAPLAFTHLAVTEAHNGHTTPSPNPNPNP